MSAREDAVELTIAYDAELQRPGCGLIQAALGATPGIAACFDTSTWLVAPTPGMRVYPLRNQDQLARLVQITEAHHHKGAS